MKTDGYTRLVLTLIAIALLADAAKGWVAIPAAYAAEPMRCEIVNKVQVEGKLEIDTFTRPIRVDVDGPVEMKSR